MQRLGFIHDMLDVKVLILCVTSRSNYPMTMQEIYEVCYQDDCLSYFDVCTAIPEMVTSGHLKALEEEKFEITEKGRETAALTEDSIAFTVKQRAENAIARFNRQIRRSSFVKTQILPRENGDFSYEAPRIPRQSHGTGDMFAAVTTGALVLEKPLHVAATLGAKFVEQAIAVTPISTPFGANFEPILPWLWEQL